MGNIRMTQPKPGVGVPDMPAQPPTSGVGVAKAGESRGRAKKLSGWEGRKRQNPEVIADAPNAVAGGKERKRATSGGGRPGWKWAVVAVLLSLIAGALVGASLPDPKNSKEYLALQSENDGLNDDLGRLQARYDTLDAGIKGRESAISDREVALEKHAADAKAADTAVKAAEAAVKKREDAVTGAEAKKEANTIREGTWTVGVDVQPGTYRVAEEVTDSCYWGIYTTGSNGSDIIDNDIVNGGRPSVTLSAGQDFRTTRCGSWNKQ
jgi:hypothetical protein